MCGRLAQTKSVRYYSNELSVTARDEFEDLDTPTGNYNAAPGAKHLIFRLDEAGTLSPENVIWHWLSSWAKEKGMPPQSNAKLEKLLGGFYRSLMKTGRIIVPADGWYEWTGDKKDRLPWYIKSKEDRPLFLAALTNHFPDQQDPEGAGFVIVTNESAGGMVDIHDRRPVVLTPEDALAWMDTSFSYQQAESVAREGCLPSDAFEWFRVSKDVNGQKFHDAHLIEPIASVESFPIQPGIAKIVQT